MDNLRAQVVRDTPAGGLTDPRPVAFSSLISIEKRPVRLRWLGPLFFRQLEADRHRHGVLHGWGSRLGACSVSKTDGLMPEGFDSSPDPLNGSVADTGKAPVS